MTAIDHLGFIVAAYAVTGTVLAAAVVVLLLDGRAQKRLLAQFAPRETEKP